MWNEIISHSVGGLRNHTFFFLTFSILNLEHLDFWHFFFFLPLFSFPCHILVSLSPHDFVFLHKSTLTKNCSCSLSFLVVTSTSLLAARRCWIFSFASSFLLTQCGPSSGSLLYPIDILDATSEMASNAPRTVPWGQAVALAEDWQKIELLLHLVGVVVAHGGGSGTQPKSGGADLKIVILEWCRVWCLSLCAQDSSIPLREASPTMRYIMY